MEKSAGCGMDTKNFSIDFFIYCSILVCFGCIFSLKFQAGEDFAWIIHKMGQGLQILMVD